MKFELSNYVDDKCAMHCKTKEEFDEFLEYLYNNGYDHLEPQFNHTFCYGDNVYYFNDCTWAHLEYAKRNHHTILEWEDFMNKEFTKADLRTGDVILQRDGLIGIVNRDLEMIVCDDNHWNDLDNVREDLTNVLGDEFDIVEVRRPTKKGECCFNAMNYKWGTLVYEYKEPEEMTLAEVCKLLGKNIKIIQ